MKTCGKIFLITAVTLATLALSACGSQKKINGNSSSSLSSSNGSTGGDDSVPQFGGGPGGGAVEAPLPTGQIEGYTGTFTSDAVQGWAYASDQVVVKVRFIYTDINDGTRVVIDGGMANICRNELVSRGVLPDCFHGWNAPLQVAGLSNRAVRFEVEAFASDGVKTSMLVLAADPSKQYYIIQTKP